jgi:hypothetical protein
MRDIVNYLVDFGPIEDFYYVAKKDSGAKTCYCLFSCS